MKQGIVRVALLVGAAAGVVAISACSPMSSGAAAPTSTTAPAPSSAPSTRADPPAGPPTNAGPPAAPEVVSAPAPTRIYFPLCGIPAVKSTVDMTSATFSCDNTLMMSNAHWTSWNSRDAQGTAVLIENDCEPDCAGGNLAHDKVDVRFDKPVTLSCGEFWTEAVFTYVGEPVGVVHDKRTWTFNPGPARLFC